jgi:ParB-like chromosome segregation protein Spo0J
MTVTREKILVDGFHRLEAAKKRGDTEIEADILEIDEEAALAAKLNTTHGKRLTVMDLASRIKLLIEEKGWSQQRAAKYFNKAQSWINDHVRIADNLNNSSVITRVINLDYRSARELAKLPKNKQEKACRLARKMAMHDQRIYPTSRVMAKVVKKIQEEPAEPDSNGNGSGQEVNRWLKPTTLWNFNSCDSY